MKLTTDDIRRAAATAGIGDEATARLLAALAAHTEGRARFDIIHVAYYLGAMLMISAMAWFLTNAWEDLGGLAIMAVGLVYAAGYSAFGMFLRRSPATAVPGGLMLTVAVALTPLIVYGFQKETGFWGFEEPGEYHDFFVWVRSGWFTMELATLAVSLAVIARVRFPFMVAVPAFVLWYVSMDLTPILFDGSDVNLLKARQHVSIGFGLLMLLAAYGIDRWTRRDFAFWLYLFGLLAFWGGMTSLNSDSELSKAIYCLINLGLIGLSVFLRRIGFVVFGGIGVFIYLGHLAESVFRDSLMFPVALSLLGLAVLLLGLWYGRNAARIEAWLQSSLPATLQAVRPAARQP